MNAALSFDSAVFAYIDHSVMSLCRRSASPPGVLRMTQLEDEDIGEWKAPTPYGIILRHGCMEVGSTVNNCAGAPEDAGGLGEDAWSIKAHSDTQARQQELVAHYTAARTPQLSEVWTALLAESLCRSAKAHQQGI